MNEIEFRPKPLQKFRNIPLNQFDNVDDIQHGVDLHWTLNLVTTKNSKKMKKKKENQMNGMKFELKPIFK